jgi:hypothetical protein
MHAITLSYSLSYAAAVRLGVGKSGTGQLDAGPVLAFLGDGERAWLAAHPKAVFGLDDVITDVVDLGDPARLARAVAREVRAAAAADDPVRLRSRIVGDLTTQLADAKGGGHVSVYVSLPRRVSDGTSMLSGGLATLTDEDVGPGLLRELTRYLDRCRGAMRRPSIYAIDEAPALFRATYREGLARYVDDVVDAALEAAQEGPLPCRLGGASWARRRHAEGVAGVALREGVWVVAEGVDAVCDARLSGVIEESIAAGEKADADKRAAENAKAREAEDAILAVLDADQRARRALDALPDHELHAAVDDALLGEIQRIVGDAYSVSLVLRDDADVDVRWGELPRGGGDVATRLHGQNAVEEWGDASSLAAGPLVAVRAVDLLDQSRVLLIERT